MFFRKVKKPTERIAQLKKAANSMEQGKKGSRQDLFHSKTLLDSLRELEVRSHTPVRTWMRLIGSPNEMGI